MLRNRYNDLLGPGLCPGPQTIGDGIQYDMLGFIMARIDQGDASGCSLETMVANVSGDKHVSLCTKSIVEQLRTAATADSDTLYGLIQ